jgi:hypothetical protein
LDSNFLLGSAFLASEFRLAREGTSGRFGVTAFAGAFPGTFYTGHCQLHTNFCAAAVCIVGNAGRGLFSNAKRADISPK